MSRYIESIRVVNGRMMNLKYHQDRVNRTYRIEKNPYPFRISELNKPDISLVGIYKYRIEYDPQSNMILQEIMPYIERKINSLKLTNADDFDYHLKYANRDFINQAYAKKGITDDILFTKNNMLTDTSYCNTAFWNGKKWLTPKEPLLKGTMRQKLLQKNIIQEEDIYIDQINTYKKIRLFNALIPWSSKKDILVKNIIK